MTIRESDIERFFEIITSGDRVAARTAVNRLHADGVPPEDIVLELFWPTMEMVEKLYRNDQLTTLSHHYAVRLLRMLVDQTAARYRMEPQVGRTVLGQVVESGEDPAEIVDREGLRPVRDRGVLEGHLRAVMEANAGKVDAYRGGNSNLRGFFVGQVMRATGGRADPRLLQEIVSEILG